MGNAPPQAEIVVATGVAANTARADLAGMVTAEKAARGISAGRNGAVFEFRIAEGGWDHVIAFSQRSVGHAERIGARELQARGVSQMPLPVFAPSWSRVQCQEGIA